MNITVTCLMMLFKFDIKALEHGIAEEIKFKRHLVKIIVMKFTMY